MLVSHSTHYLPWLHLSFFCLILTQSLTCSFTFIFLTNTLPSQAFHSIYDVFVVFLSIFFSFAQTIVLSLPPVAEVCKRNVIIIYQLSFLFFSMHIYIISTYITFIHTPHTQHLFTSIVFFFRFGVFGSYKKILLLHIICSPLFLSYSLDSEKVTEDHGFTFTFFQYYIVYITKSILGVNQS
jgi:hypothetical protein